MSRSARKPQSPRGALSLRPVERRDLPLLRAWKNDPVARRWIGDGTRTFSEEDMERWFARTEERIDRDRRWIVEEDVRPVGFVGLYGIDPVRRHAELGILLDPKARRRGIGRAATELLLDEAFGILNLNRVTLEVLADHAVALAMYRACGFKKEGRLREHNFKDGRYVDVIVMGILASERRRKRRRGAPR